MNDCVQGVAERPTEFPWRALAGPTLAGACLGLGSGLQVAALWALTLPGLILTVTALGLPALYIAITLTGDAPPLSAVAARAIAGLESTGIVLLGLSPALGFLVLTTGPESAIALGLAVVALASVLALRSFFFGLFGPERALERVSSLGLTVYVCWCVLVLSIGCEWFWSRAVETLGGAL